MLRRKLLATALMTSLALGSPAARAGLIESVYHNIPVTAYTPTDASISATQANAAAVNPNYTFINSAITFNYTNSSAQTNTYLGADAAGAAATDTGSTLNSAFDARGIIKIKTAGNYTFNIASADDAARVYLSNTLIAEQSYPGSGLAVPASSTQTLGVGSYAFDLFYYQQTGGLNLSFTVTGAGAVTYDVSEPSSIGLLAAAVLAFAGMTYRHRREGGTKSMIEAVRPRGVRAPVRLPDVGDQPPSCSCQLQSSQCPDCSASEDWQRTLPTSRRRGQAVSTLARLYRACRSR